MGFEIPTVRMRWSREEKSIFILIFLLLFCKEVPVCPYIGHTGSFTLSSHIELPLKSNSRFLLQINLQVPTPVLPVLEV